MAGRPGALVGSRRGFVFLLLLLLLFWSLALSLFAFFACAPQCSGVFFFLLGVDYMLLIVLVILENSTPMYKLLARSCQKMIPKVCT